MSTSSALLRETDDAPERGRLVESDLGAHWGGFARVPGARACGGPDVRWVASGTPVMNRVWGARFSAGDAARRVDEVRDVFRARGVPVTWLLAPHDRPAELGRLLSRAGFARDEAARAMSLELDQLSQVTAPGEGFAVREAASHEDVTRWAELYAASLGLGLERDHGRALARLYAHRVDEGAPLRLFEGLLDGRPVTACALHGMGHVVGLHDVATRSDARRCGLARALVAAALTRARGCGARRAVLLAPRSTEPLYTSLGFAGHQTWGVYRWNP